MRVVLDACVLYPTVMREVLMGTAAKGLFVPLWSARILEEWARAVARNLPDQAEVARVEIALLRARWPEAEVEADAGLTDSLFLPDVDDRHVLASAITGKADVLLTVNTKDFPTRVLGQHGVVRRDPDGLLVEFLQEQPEDMRAVCLDVHGRAEAISGEKMELRRLLKKARLPRLAKAVGGRLD